MDPVGAHPQIGAVPHQRQRHLRDQGSLVGCTLVWIWMRQRHLTKRCLMTRLQKKRKETRRWRLQEGR